MRHRPSKTASPQRRPADGTRRGSLDQAPSRDPGRLAPPPPPRPEAEGDVVVYLDQSRLGGPETLRTIQVNAATAIRHYSASEAEARFGPGHLHGAIQIITAR